MSADIQSHPDYRQGFYDAMEGEPLYGDASPGYGAGWHAYHDAVLILARCRGAIAAPRPDRGGER